MFGWVFLTPAHGDDPLSVAAQEIEELNNKVSNLVYQDDFIDLIDISENKFTYAKNAMELKEDAYDAYDDAVHAEATALEDKNLAQSNVDGKTATVALALEHKDNALEEKNDAQDALGIANINVQTTQSNIQSSGGSGLAYTVYNLLRNGNQAVPGSVICTGTWNSNSMSLPVCGRYENIIVKFTGKITVPDHWTQTYFAGSTDDGFRMYVDGQLAVNNWVEQGVTWSDYSPVYDVTEDKTLDVEIWWYNGGGPGSYHLGWAIPGGWTGAGCDYTGEWGVGFSCDLGTFSSGSGPTQSQLDAYDEALEARATAQTNYNNKLSVYNDKLSVYNSENAILSSINQILQTKTQEHLDAVADTEDALELKKSRIEIYNQSIVDLNNAINDAWEYYYEQAQRELNAAIAQAAANAAANQPKPEPSPEPTVEPTPEPSPEPTVDPTPDPTPEVTPDPEPTPEPTTEPTKDPEPEPEPTVEPTQEPTVEPTPEPTPGPEPTVDPEPTPEKKPGIKDEELAALVPEKGTGTTEDLSGVIANLTSKDNKLVKLSPEQVAAVSQTLKALTVESKAEIAGDLGIAPAEVAKIAEQMKDNPALASAFVEFESRAGDAGEAPMPYTLADATTEVQTEAFLADPLGAFTDIDLEKILNPSEWGKDMTDDQREKAQEVVIPVIIASNIIAAAMTRRI
jgi:outer membrane biosynthesis protein TonB